MAVKLIPMTCPNCKASIEIDGTKDFCFCTYCGTKILVNDDSTRTININHHYTETDEAKIEEIKSKERIHARELWSKDSYKKSANRSFIIMAIFCVVGFLVLGIHGAIEDKKQTNHFEQLSQEILVDIENGDYSSAKLKANQIQYTANFKSGEKEKWDEVRETLLEEIAKAENGGELPKESLGDKISNVFKKDE